VCVTPRTSRALLLDIKRVMLNTVKALLELVLVLSTYFLKEKYKFIFVISYSKTDEVLALEVLEKLPLLRLVGDFDDC